MAFDLELSGEAEEDLRRMSPAVRAVTATALHRLAESPSKYGRPAPCPPYLPRSQVYEVQEHIEGNLHQVAILFQYAADEQTLWILNIGHVHYR